MINNLLKTHRYLLILLCFTIPLAWWTRLNANYYSTKLCLLFFTSAFALLGLKFKFSIPKLPKILFFTTAYIVLHQIVLHTYRFDYADFLNIFKFLSFLFLCTYFYVEKVDLNKFLNQLTYLVLIAVVFILGVSVKEYYLIRIVNMSLELGSISTFGNINMFAEFLILALPLVFLWTRHKDKIPHLIKLALFTLWVFFILYCRSRSAWVGLGLWFVLLLRYKISKKEIICIGLAFVFYFATMHAPSTPNANSNVVESSKQHNIFGRWELIQATIGMTTDNAWGIRPGAYIGEIEPYQISTNLKPSEFSYYDQPHSEFFKWAAQFGWLFIFVSVVFFLAVAVLMFKWFFVGEQFFLVGSFIVLVPQILFQFPYENPASLVYLSLVTAIFFLSFPVLKEYTLHKGFRFVTVVLAAVGIWNSYAFVNSVYEESTYPRTEAIVSACDYYPINIKTCHAKLDYFLNTKSFTEFTEHFKTDFMRQPFFVDYLRLLPTYYSIKADNKKTCQALFLYRTIFPKTETFEKKYFDNCSGFPDIFYFENPKQFRNQYMTWLNNLN